MLKLKHAAESFRELAHNVHYTWPENSDFGHTIVEHD